VNARKQYYGAKAALARALSAAIEAFGAFGADEAATKLAHAEDEIQADEAWNFLRDECRDFIAETDDIPPLMRRVQELREAAIAEAVLAFKQTPEAKALIEKAQASEPAAQLSIYHAFSAFFERWLAQDGD
jgi:hypothetical protein